MRQNVSSPLPFYGEEEENVAKGIAWKLADMATSLEANRMLVQKAAWLRDSDQPCTKECSMAKLWQTEMLGEVVLKHFEGMNPQEQLQMMAAPLDVKLYKYR